MKVVERAADKGHYFDDIIHTTLVGEAVSALMVFIKSCRGVDEKIIGTVNLTKI